MAHDPRVTNVLARLGGVYRDPARVDRDTAALLNSSVGAHLAPNPCLMDNISVLTLQGTIAMHFRGNTYQLLMDIFLPPRYPNQPPACFVRLASPNMYLKQNHKHVDSTGKVYLPYLHEWNRSTHNLIELVVVMSSVFSNDPPVFTRASSAPTTTTEPRHSGSSTASSSSWQPPPPPPPPVVDADADDAILQVAIAESNEAAAAAERSRRAQLEEQERTARAAATASMEQQERLVLARSQLDDKVRRYLLQKLTELQKQQAGDVRDEKQLEWALEHKIERQLEYLETAKVDLTAHLARTEQSIQEIEQWLQHAEEQAQQASSATATDQMQVVPLSPQDAQLLDLEATNASLTDALYFLDRALYQGQLDCEQHLKQVRQCAKEQFLVRAHLLKIQQKYGS